MTPATRPAAAAAFAVALALVGSTPTAAEDRRGESACYGSSSEAPTENIVITAFVIGDDGVGWSGSGPVQSLFDTGPDGTPRFVSTEEEVFDLVVSLRHIGPTSGLGIVPKSTNPHPIRRGLCGLYNSSREGSFPDVLNVNVYRLGTVRGPEDEDPRRNMPPVAPYDRRGKSGCYGSSSGGCAYREHRDHHRHDG